MPSTSAERRARAAIALAAVGCALAVVAPALWRGHGLLATGSLWRVPPWSALMAPGPGNPALVDQLLYFPPFRELVRAEYLAGRLPSWNPFILGGVPLAGCVQAAPFFPTAWLLAPLTAVPYSLAAAFLKVLAAALFTGLHLRRLGASPSGCALGAAVFSLGGFMTVWLGHPHANTACLLPGLFWAIGRLCDAPGSGRAAVLGLLTGLALLGGHPPTMFHVGLLSAAYFAFSLARAPRSSRAPLLGWALAAAAVGAALAGPALLPYLEYYPLSSTGAASDYLARWGQRLSPWALLHLAAPLASGSPGWGGEVLAAAFGLAPKDNFVERAGWTGLIPLALAGLAAWRRRREPEALFHLGLAAFCLAAVFGLPPLPLLWKSLPGFASMNPTRLLLGWTFGVAVLAGLGAEPDPRDWTARDRHWARAAVFLAALLCAALAYWRYAPILPELTREEAAAATAVILIAGVEACLFWLFLEPARRPWAALPAALFALTFGWGANPTAPASSFYPAPPSAEAARAVAGEGRLLGLGWAFEPNTAMTQGLRDARGRDFTTPARYERLVTGRATDFAFWTGEMSADANLSLLAVGALAATKKTVSAVPKSWVKVHEGDLFVFRSPAPARRALFVPAAAAGSEDEVLAAVRAPGFDPARLVLLDDGPVPPAPARAARGSARIIQDGTSVVEVEVDAGGPGWLLLLDNWYPGWTATVDGVAVPVRRADHAFRAVELPAGARRVVFSYEPGSLRAGLALSLLAALALAAAWALRPRR
jgi:hypothetical protein